MIEIRTLLCPVDFSPATPRQIGLAGELARLFGARLVLHHNVSAADTAAGVGWMWAASHDGPITPTEAERRLGELLDSLPAGVTAEARITRGLPTQAVLAVRDATAADLILMTTHGPTDEEHTSVTSQILERVDCLLVALHEETVEGAAPHVAGRDATPHVVLVPTDLTPQSMGAVRFAFELARVLPARIHLLHVDPPSRRGGAVDEALIVERERQMRELVPADLEGRVGCHQESGDPADGIRRAAERFGASFIVMGEHTRAPLRRWFSRDTSRAVLHRAPCPVWYVPPRAA